MMVTGTIDESQQRAAKVAGCAYLATFVIVVYVNFAIHDRLIVDNAAETARIFWRTNGSFASALAATSFIAWGLSCS